MLAIRMQRTGRKGHAMFRVIVQDARRTPTSGKIVARLGSYDPHAKTVTLDKEKASFYLEHGAQPSERVASLLKKEGVKLPEWVKLADKREGNVRNPEKRRSTRPDEPAPAEEAPAAETETAEAPEAKADKPEAKAEASEKAEAEKPAEETKAPETEKPADKPEEPAEAPAEAQPAEESAEKPTEDTANDNQEKPDKDKS